MQVLFRPISKDEEDALRGRYAGTQAERNSAAGAKDKKAADKGVRSRLPNGQSLSGPAPSCTFAGDCLHRLSDNGVMTRLPWDLPASTPSLCTRLRHLVLAWQNSAHSLKKLTLLCRWGPYQPRWLQLGTKQDRDERCRTFRK